MDEIINPIYEGLCRHDEASPPRGYLGMSSIGRPCQLESWFSWRQTTGSYTDGRILMLFDTGHHVEMIIVRAMRLAGYILKNAYPDTQLAFSDHGGFFRGHADGLVKDENGDMILEIKSSNTNKFKQFQEKRVHEVYPAYYVQMQLYMHYANVKRALFLVMKKDDSSLYAEIVPYDEVTAKNHIILAARIIQTHDDSGSMVTPDRISDDPKSEECKWCRYKVPCHEPGEAIQKVISCRSCAHLDIGEDFKPSCGHHDHKLPLTDISRACPQWAWVWSWQVPF